MHDQVAFVDIETIPDDELVPADLQPGDFPPIPCHRVVAIGMVVADIVRDQDGEWFKVTEVRCGGREEFSEAELLRGFWSWFARVKPRIVTWNGRRFDLPVLKIRAMVHGVAAAHWHTAGDRWRGYGQRYSSDWHCDLAEVLSDYGAARIFGLDLMARSIGLPGKVGGHGSEVASMFAEGRVRDIRAYCEGDVLNLFGIYVRWALLAGVTGPAGHDASVHAMIEYLASQRSSRAHLGEFLDMWTASTRPSPTCVTAAASAVGSLGAGGPA